LVVTIVGLVAVVSTWPSLPFAEAPASAAVLPGLVSAPDVEVTTMGGTTIWGPPISLPWTEAAVVGLGAHLVAVAVSDRGTWPASVLVDGEWRRLLGLPPGFTFAPGIGVERRTGFALVGASGDDDSVIFEFDEEGGFGGARTVRGVSAGAVTSVGEATVVFDVRRADGRVVAAAIEPITPPGPVVAAAGAGEWIVILVDGGTLYAAALEDNGAWIPLGTGFADLLGGGIVVAVGRDATVGLQVFESTSGLIRLDRAPVGPTVLWDDRIAVYDWSNDSVWMSTGEGWERLPLWKSQGFGAPFGWLVPGARVPAVVGVDDAGQPGLWLARG
jgi:hypothetical protein